MERFALPLAPPVLDELFRPFDSSDMSIKLAADTGFHTCGDLDLYVVGSSSSFGQHQHPNFPSPPRKLESRNAEESAITFDGIVPRAIIPEAPELWAEKNDILTTMSERHRTTSNGAEFDSIPDPTVSVHLTQSVTSSSDATNENSSTLSGATLLAVDRYKALRDGYVDDERGLQNRSWPSDHHGFCAIEALSGATKHTLEPIIRRLDGKESIDPISFVQGVFGLRLSTHAAVAKLCSQNRPSPSKRVIEHGLVPRHACEIEVTRLAEAGQILNTTSRTSWESTIQNRLPPHASSALPSAAPLKNPNVHVNVTRKRQTSERENTQVLHDDIKSPIGQAIAEISRSPITICSPGARIRAAATRGGRALEPGTDPNDIERNKMVSTHTNTASRYCHICTRADRPASVARCQNIEKGKCRKVVCARCARENGWVDALEVIGKHCTEWSCVHCRGICPFRAQCKTYGRVNRLRKERGRALAKDSRTRTGLRKKSCQNYGKPLPLKAGFNSLTTSSGELVVASIASDENKNRQNAFTP
jgi:hypothetical protein